MGLLSRLFGKRENKNQIRKRPDEPDVINVENEDERMNWAMEKSRLTLHYFESCLTSPKEGQQYFSIKVKIEDGQIIEHIWLSDPVFDEEGNLFGTIGNTPIDVRNVKLGQKIGIDRDLVSDWMIVENGRLIGGYTIRVLRENLTGRALADFDKQLGGMHIDEGEDYFLPDDSTPEGAIVKIETAFNEDNLDKAADCKDFRKEAEMMLAKFKDKGLDDEVIDKTAEVLKLGFLKSLQEDGIPKFNDLKQAFPKREKVSDNHMIITEVCYYPDRTKSIQRLNTYYDGSGWKVGSPVE
jgi:uncharacterized protein YegJ (DUF2314 family)